MQPPTLVARHEDMQIVGFKIRTRNSAEVDPKSAEIPKLWHRFFEWQARTKQKRAGQPAVIIAVYSDYESDENGAYTLTLGAESNSVGELPEGMVTRTIPAGTYTRVTSDKGQMPLNVIDAWKTIWQATPEWLGGRRAFQTDFEIYDERCRNSAESQIDIYLSLKPWN